MMPDPISSAGNSVDWCSSGESEPLSAPVSVALPAAAIPNVCLTTDASFGSEVPVGTAGLIEKFQQGHYAFVAAATASNDSTPQASASGSGKSAASSKNPDDQVNLQVGLPRLERHTTIGGVHLFG